MKEDLFKNRPSKSSDFADMKHSEAGGSMAASKEKHVKDAGFSEKDVDAGFVVVKEEGPDLSEMFRFPFGRFK